MKLYTKQNCRFCDLAKEYLDSKNVDYEIIDITDDTKQRSYLQSLGITCVPRLFIHHELVENGYDGILSLTDAELGITND